MTEPDASDAEILALAASAGLSLPDTYAAELTSAYRHVRRMLVRMRHARQRTDEPAHIFKAASFRPVGDRG